MQITRVSKYSNTTNTQEIDVTHEQLDAWRSGVLIQVAMPHLSADEREFIMTGITSDEWNKLFPPESEDVTW
tara:strand:- start:142 stop:357 length:216 start_codon:yes stop_codon:yes gene_type:complete